MKIYNEELQRLQAAMMEETRLEAKLAELMCQQKELVKKQMSCTGVCGRSRRMWNV